MDLLRANALCAAGTQLREEGRREEAEAAFREALAINPLPAARNNLALCRWQAGDHEGALAILQPVITATEPAPYAFALASLCLQALDRTDLARQHLDRAVIDMDRGLSDPSLRGPVSEEAWHEYGVTVKQAAGSLGDHRLVLRLHKRWPAKYLPRGAFAAGLAAFNLGRYDEAVHFWGGVYDASFLPLVESCTSAARWVEARVVPPFPLPYAWDDRPPLAGAFTEDHAEAMVEDGLNRAYILHRCLDGKDAAMPLRADLAAALVRHGGTWGLDLGHRLLEAGAVPDAVKFAAFEQLVLRGELPADRPVPVTLGGRRALLHYRQLSAPVDQDVRNRYHEAIRLRDAGRKDEAYRLLKALDPVSHAFPPGLVALANLMRERRELDQAQTLLELAEALAPQDPAPLVNLAALWLQRGNARRAFEYYQQLTRLDLPPELRRLADLLGEALGTTASATSERFLSIQELGDAYRLEIDDRPISPEITLRAALKGVPVEWLNAAAAAAKVVPARHRKEREAQVAAALLTPEVLADVVASLQPTAERVLRVVLERGGSCKYQTVARFGSQVGDGFWWDESPPASPLGQLRARGLLYIGRARVGTRFYRTAVVPIELRPLLASLLGLEGS